MMMFSFIGCKKDSIAVTTQNEEASTANVSANTSENIRNIPIEAVFYNECCNEEVYVAGTAHFVTTNNVMHLEVSNITGIGLSTGFNYVSLSPSVETNVFYSNHYVGIFTFILNMKNDNGCSFRLKATFQLHVNANGDITIEFQKLETFCY
jgi:hypothetical protein